LKGECPEKIRFVSELEEIREGEVTDSSTRFGYFIAAFDTMEQVKEYINL